MARAGSVSRGQQSFRRFTVPSRRSAVLRARRGWNRCFVSESAQERQNRELIELLNELRVALPGVQVLFAFLLAVPFANGFPKLSPTDRDVFFAAFIATALSTVLLIAPSSYHRLRWRQHDKERMLVISNGLTIAGLACLAIAITCVFFVITDFLSTGRGRRSSPPSSRQRSLPSGTACRSARLFGICSELDALDD